MVATYGMSLKDVLGGDDPWPAESRLIEACKLGEQAVICGERPEKRTDENCVRAALIRHLMLGGCDAARSHPRGISLIGAWIEGVLDLEECHCDVPLALVRCHFLEALVFSDSRMQAVILSGSNLPELEMARLRTEGNVFLREMFRASGVVNLVSARIGGHLDCGDGMFEQGLKGDGMQVARSIYLSDGFQASGSVNLSGVHVGGQLHCKDGRFEHGLNGDSMRVDRSVFISDGFRADGLVNLPGARIGGQLACDDGWFEKGIILQDINVEQGFFWIKIDHSVPMLVMSEAKVGVLVDDASSWRQVDELFLSGLTYRSLQSDMGIADRLTWLERACQRYLPEDLAKNVLRQPWIIHEPKRFDPQPYTQLSNVLEGQGDRVGAARVRQERERRVSDAAKLRELARIDGHWRWTLVSDFLMFQARRAWDWVFGAVFGYGHQPIYALWWVLGIWGFAVLLYGAAYDAGQMAPNSDVVLTSAAWGRALAQGCATVQEAGCVMPIHLWLEMPEARDYETFSRGTYALDLFVPLDALGQETTWAPSKTRGTLGWIGHYARLPIQIAGWVITAVGAAVLTGLVGRKE